jgi:hypothetical protein
MILSCKGSITGVLGKIQLKEKARLTRFMRELIFKGKGRN